MEGAGEEGEEGEEGDGGGGGGVDGGGVGGGGEGAEAAGGPRKRPRGMAPNGTNGLRMRWDVDAGCWMETDEDYWAAQAASGRGGRGRGGGGGGGGGKKRAWVPRLSGGGGGDGDDDDRLLSNERVKDITSGRFVSRRFVGNHGFMAAAISEARAHTGDDRCAWPDRPPDGSIQA